MDLREYEKKWESIDADADLPVAEENHFKKYVPPEVTHDMVVAQIAAACEAFAGDVSPKLRWLVRSGNTRPDFLEGFACGDVDDEADAARWRAYFSLYSTRNSALWDQAEPVPARATRTDETLAVETRALTEFLSTPLTVLLALRRAYGPEALAWRLARRRDPLRVDVVAAAADPGGEERWIVLQQLLGGATAPPLHVHVFGAGGAHDARPPETAEGRPCEHGGRVRLLRAPGPYASRLPADLVFLEDAGPGDAGVFSRAADAPLAASVRCAGDLDELRGALPSAIRVARALNGPNPFASLLLGDRGCGSVERRNARVVVFAAPERCTAPPPPPPPKPKAVCVAVPWPLRETQKAIKANKPGCAEYSCGKEGANLACGRCKLTFYCSAACQRRAWAYHKAACAGPNPTTSAKLVALLPPASTQWSAEQFPAVCVAPARAKGPALLDAIVGVRDCDFVVKERGRAPTDEEARVDRALCKRFNWESSASDALNGYRDGGDFYYRLFFDAAYRDRKDDLQKNTVAVALHGDPEARGSFLVAKLSSRDDARLPVTPREVAEVAAERFASAAARGLTDRMFAQHMRDTELDFIMQAANAAKR